MRKERLLEEIEVHYDYGTQDLTTQCVRIGLVDSQSVILYCWGRSDAVGIRLDEAALELLQDQLCECAEIITEAKQQAARRQSSKD